jgi:hypothetical protein
MILTKSEIYFHFRISKFNNFFMKVELFPKWK